jgi:hypothetical protein
MWYNYNVRKRERKKTPPKKIKNILKKVLTINSNYDIMIM